MSSRLRIGVVGCGAIAWQVHIPLLRGRADVRLAAFADSDYDVLAETVLRFRGAQPYASLEDMLAEAELDAVVVTLPTALHATAARAVFDAGRHLFLEKPLATTLEDGAAVVEAWRRAGTVGVMGYNCRANPLFGRLRALMQAGRAGGLVYLRTVFATAPRPLPEWKQQRASGGGALLDLGAHHIDLIRFLTDREITGVRATIRSRCTEHDTALLELELDGGAGAHAFFSLASAESEHVEVHGEAARLSVSRFTSLDVDVIDNPGDGGGVLARGLFRAGALRHVGRALRARRAPLREPGYALLLDRFITAARTGTVAADIPDIADGFACAAVIAAAEQSAVSGRMEAPAPVPAATGSLLQGTP
jgi:predicted dehydrogenase